MIWTTAGETFETTASRELFKSRSKFGDAGAFEGTACASVAVRTCVDCANAGVAATTQAISPYFIDCKRIIERKAFKPKLWRLALNRL
jgi:hypothetical protein